MSETVQIESFNAEFLTKQKLHDLIFTAKVLISRMLTTSVKPSK